MTPRIRRALSRLTGWLADRRVPGPLRGPLYGSYARVTGADPSEARLPLGAYPSLQAFFVRRLRDGARPVDPAPDRLVSPCDGRIQALDRVSGGSLLQAKGQTYEVEELLAGMARNAELEGSWAWTLYLSPRDYHRVHAPFDVELGGVRWAGGDRRSVAPGVVGRVPRVFATNERAVLRLESEHGPAFLVMVGALNVGRIRVVGVEPGASPTAPVPFTRGAELARFEMGSTVVLVLPPGRAEPLPGAEPGDAVRLGEALGVLR